MHKGRRHLIDKGALRVALRRCERRLLRVFLARANWNVTKAASLAGINRTLMHELMTFHGITNPKTERRRSNAAWRSLGEEARH